MPAALVLVSLNSVQETPDKTLARPGQFDVTAVGHFVQDSSGVVPQVNAIIDQEASALGVCQGRANAYKQRFNTYYKTGHHWVIRHNYSITGLAQLPACSGSTIVLQDHVWGAFLEGAQNSPGTAFTSARVEPLRAPIRERLSQ